MKRIFLTQILSILIIFISNAQVLINEVWSTSSGEPQQADLPISQWDEIDWSSSALTSNNELVTVGNTLQSIGNTDVLITKYTNDGQIAWEQTFAGSAGSYDYGLATAIDNNGNVIVAGVLTTNNQTTDIVILKYSNSGALVWSQILDGGNNQFDIPTSVAIDSGNNVYLAGGTLNLSTQTDWYISKLNSNGVFQWSTSYNYADFHELAVGIEALVGGDIAVNGFSGSGTSTWDFARLTFSGQDGSVLSENRENIPNISLDDALAVANDNSNNIYIAGSTIAQSGTSKDIQLVKINNNFDIEWVRTIDAEGLEDKAKSLAIDNSGNIIIAGNSEKTNNGTQITIAKFTPDGIQQFKRDYLAPATYETAKVAKLRVTNEGDILVTGSVDREGNKDIVTLLYDTNGNQRVEKFYKNDDTSNDLAQSLEITSTGEVLVTGRSKGDETKYTAVKYRPLKRSDEIVLQDGKPHHRGKEFIVKFLPQYVNTNFVDDKKKRYGTIDEILLTDAATTIKERIELRSALFSKVYPRLSTSHIQSLTRLGETIPIPEFWSVFLVVLEDGQDLEELLSDFEEMTEFIVYAHYNHLNQHHTLPNDDFFVSNDQSSLFPSDDFPDAHINVEPAWDIETGQNYTKVGVYDNVIFWAHEDFGDGTLEGSQIEGGWDFNNNTNVTAATDPESHGTAVGGIIGALRDNETGIAGVAGGGLDAQGNDNAGVQLFSLGIFDDEFAGDDVVGPAIVEGAMFDETQNPPGYGLHIQNHSWGGPDSPTKENAIEFAWRNQCILVASRGNDGNEDFNFPATYDDNWILSVGGNGDNGEYYDGDNGNNFIDGSGAFFDGASFGEDMDIIAPAVTELVMSLINPNFPWDAVVGGVDLYPPPVGADDNYQVFNGTSAAAPHVSGVAALMYSRHHVNQGQPNNLAPEDVEFILQRYATDIVNDDEGFPVGYDDENGWGRLNAFEAVQRIDGPQWQVFHSGEPDNTNQTTAVDFQIQLPIGIGSLAAGIYNADRVQVTNTYLDIFSPTTQIIDSWDRLSSTTGISAANPVSGNVWADFDYTIQGNVAAVTTTTFAWHVTSSINGQNVDVWIPAPPQDLRTTYSLHLFDPQATSIEEISQLGTVSIFPNPSTGKFNLIYDLDDAKAVSIQLIDITGKLIYEATASNERAGEVSLDLSGRSSGMYICRLITDKGVISKKVVKQ